MKKWIVITVLMCAAPAWGATVKLTWNPNTEPDLAGYRIYQTETPGAYDKATQRVADISATANQQKTADVQVNFTDGRTVYFVATAYDTSGNESGFSNEVSFKTSDTTPPAAPSILSVLEQIANAAQSIVTDGLKIKVIQ